MVLPVVGNVTSRIPIIIRLLLASNFRVSGYKLYLCKTLLLTVTSKQLQQYSKQQKRPEVLVSICKTSLWSFHLFMLFLNSPDRFLQTLLISVLPADLSFLALQSESLHTGLRERMNLSSKQFPYLSDESWNPIVFPL